VFAEDPRRSRRALGRSDVRATTTGVGREELAAVGVGVDRHRDPELAEVRQAGDLPGLGLGVRQGRQQDRDQQADDADHDEQFDQREGGRSTINGPGTFDNLTPETRADATRRCRSNLNRYAWRSGRQYRDCSTSYSAISKSE